VQNRLIVEEIKHVLDGKWQRALAVRRAENRLKQVVDELLHGHLGRQYHSGNNSKHRPIILCHHITQNIHSTD